MAGRTKECRPAKGERTRQRILVAGRAVFGRDGYARSRMSDIAHEAGLSQGAIYRYFRNKDEVFSVVLGTLVDQSLFDSARVGDHQNLQQAIRQANLGYLGQYWEIRDIFRPFHEAAATDIRYQELRQRMRSRFRQRFLSVLQRETGVKPDRELEMLVLALQCCVEGIAYSSFAEPASLSLSPPLDVEEAARVTSAVWLAAFRDVLPSPQQDTTTEPAKP
jgi:AcrR family transcriptional regulator